MNDIFFQTFVDQGVTKLHNFVAYALLFYMQRFGTKCVSMVKLALLVINNWGYTPIKQAMDPI